MNKKFDDTDSQWKFLDVFRGTVFNGEWPTLGEMFSISCLRFPKNRCFFTFVPKEESFDYPEVDKLRNQIAARFIAEGVKKGDKIVLTGKNSPEWAIAFLAIVTCGAIVVPLDYSYHDEEIENCARFVDAKWLLVDKERINSIDKDNQLGLKRISLESGDEQHPFLLDFLAPETEKVAVDENDLAAILFTSGTTGTPKGVMLSHKNLVSDCYTAQSQLHVYPTDVFYAILPIQHAYTMQSVFIETIGSGASCLFGKKLVISQVLKDLKQGKVTMFLGVPMLFNKMIGALMRGVKKKGFIVYGAVRFMMGFSGLCSKILHKNIGKVFFKSLLSNLSLDTNRLCICGGGPLPSSTYKMFNQLGIDFVQGYGLTEASPMTHLTPPKQFIVTSVGRSFPGEEVKIVDPDENGNGVIYIKGPNVMQGYYHNEEATKEVLNDGWLNTGDVGHIDAENYLYLTGRAKNIIVTEGGKNVFPEEIEDRFQLYDAIDNLCILGFEKNKKTKEEGLRIIIHPTAQVMEEAKSQKDPDAYLKAKMEAIVAEVNKTLRPYEKIERVTVSSHALPITSTKKVKRFLVAKEFAAIF